MVHSFDPAQECHQSIHSRRLQVKAGIPQFTKVASAISPLLYIHALHVLGGYRYADDDNHIQRVPSHHEPSYP